MNFFKRQLFFSLLVIFPVNSVYAEALHYFVGTSLTTSDNIVKSADAESGQEYSLDTGISGLRKGSLIEAGGDAKLSYFSREKELFDNSEEVSANGVLFMNFSVLPTTFAWNNNVTANTVLVDSRQAANADNLSDQVSYNTEPEWRIKLSSVDSILLSASYKYIEQEELSDSKRLSGKVSWQHKMVAGQLSVNHVYEDIDNDETVPGATVSPGYRTEEFFLGYAKNLRSVDVDFNIGEERISIDGVDSDNETLSLRAIINWTPWAGSRIRAKYSVGYEDNISQLNQLLSSNVQDLQASETAIGSALALDTINAISKTKNSSVDYEQKVHVNNIKIQFAKIEQEHFRQITSANNDEIAGRLSISRQLNPGMRFTFKEHYIEKLFEQGEISRDYLTALQLHWRLSKRLIVDIDLVHENQSSDFPSAEFEALSGVLSFRYTDIL